MRAGDFVKIVLKNDNTIEGEVCSVTDVIILIDCRIIFYPGREFKLQEWVAVPLTSILYITPEKRPKK